MRWSSQILSEKKSMPFLWSWPSWVVVEAVRFMSEVRLLRCDLRNMLDLPQMQGATATVFIATYIFAWAEERNVSSRRPP